MAARNWIQVPNTYDQPRQDQRQKVISFNIAPGYQRTIDAHTLFSVNAFFGRDQVNYYPSDNSLGDSPATLAQDRSLTNFGLHADVSSVRGRHNWKAGLQVTQTRLEESFSLGITDSAYNPPSMDGGAVPGLSDPSQCGALGLPPNPGFLSSLVPYDLTRGGGLCEFHGKANINQAAFFGQDSITLGDLTLNFGLRFDRYAGLTDGSGAQPRGAFSYLIKQTKTAFRGGYTHTL